MKPVSAQRATAGALPVAVVATILALATALPSLASEPTHRLSDRLRCNAYDLEVLTLTEKAGENGTLAGNDVLELHTLVLKARKLCAEGRPVEGVALYEAIIKLFF